MNRKMRSLFKEIKDLQKTKTQKLKNATKMKIPMGKFKSQMNMIEEIASDAEPRQQKISILKRDKKIFKNKTKNLRDLQDNNKRSNTHFTRVQKEKEYVVQKYLRKQWLENSKFQPYLHYLQGNKTGMTENFSSETTEAGKNQNIFKH